MRCNSMKSWMVLEGEGRKSARRWLNFCCTIKTRQPKILFCRFKCCAIRIKCEAIFILVLFSIQRVLPSASGRTDKERWAHFIGFSFILRLFEQLNELQMRIKINSRRELRQMLSCLKPLGLLLPATEKLYAQSSSESFTRSLRALSRI